MTAALVIDADLIALYQPDLLRFARGHVRDAELAHDLVQETWAAAITAAARFEGRSSVRTWLTAILRRKIVDHHRRHRPQVSLEDHHVEPTPPPERERLDDLAALRVIDAELPGLPRREREAVTLCDVEGVSRDDAADTMGVTRGALRVLLHRGRAKLKAALHEAERLAGSLGVDPLSGSFAL